MKNTESRFGETKKSGGIGGGMTIEKDDKPGPTSYDIEGSHRRANEFRGRNVFDKTKRVSFCEEMAKNSISPGPGKHNYSI